METSFYNLTAKTPHGKLISMSEFKNKPILVVNTATKCGLTPQFEGLEALHQKYRDSGLVVLGFPCNQFGSQEPETNETLEEVCKVNHGVTFQLFEKSDVNGSDTNPVFQYLKKKKTGFLGSSAIKWNFTKFLIDRNGRVIKRFAPVTKPASIEEYVKKVL